MKTFYTLAFSTLMLSGMLLLESNISGPSSGSSGSPLEGNRSCAQSGCHSGTANTGTGSLTIDGITSYKPGQTYTINVNIGDESASKFGVQATILDSKNASVGTITAGSGMRMITSAGVKYVEHSSPKSTGSFSFTWKAPDTDAGEITIYAAGNAANGDNSTNGDKIYTKTAKISTATSIEENGIQHVAVYPNPSNGNFSVSLNDLKATNISIINMNGQLVKSFTQSNLVQNININDLQQGVYILKVESLEGNYTERIVIE